MTAQELISLLQKYPSDTPVVVRYEDVGWRDIWIREAKLFRSASGRYGQFYADKLQGRNNLNCVEL